MRNSGNTILITGGGSGLGRELARRFADQGNSVIVAGRRLDALQETIEGRDNITAIAADMDDGAGIEAFAADLIAQHPALNVVIANAGIMRYEDVSRSRDLSDAEATITTNLLGPIRLIDALVDHLAAQADAAIVTVSSGLAFVPMPATATYCATKAAIHSYTVSLRQKLQGKVEVIELVPPAVQTDLTPGQATRDGYMPLADFIDEAMAQFAQEPTPPEILVDRVKPLRNAEAEGAYADRLALLSQIQSPTS